jgi:maltooligosyltrehalose trehalohydrolase
VSKGRREFLSQFPSIASEAHALLLDPASPDTFERCKLDLSERESHREIVALHRDLLALRRTDHVFGAMHEVEVDGAVLGTHSFVLRYFGDAGDDRLLIVNFGCEVTRSPVPEPLLAPPAAMRWKRIWSSEEIAYGGDGTPDCDYVETWHLPAHSALVLAAQR